MMGKKNKRTLNKNKIQKSILSNESGSVLLTTVIILMLITIIGVSGINTSSTDIQITRNYRIQKLNVALADAAVNHAKSYIVYGLATPADTWVNNITALWNRNNNYLNAQGAWDTVNTPVLNAINVSQVIADWGNVPEITPASLPGEPNTQFVVYTNLNSTDGNSVVIVRSQRDGADVIIEAGFNNN
ncbi:MAG: pilus assembly PilX N-terminal domain-containing protein [Desulfobacter sp.]|nr:MAG: pilus assembly PilX N-terminal domain-containing protein [Desulfobacter sp.]